MRTLAHGVMGALAAVVLVVIVVLWLVTGGIIDLLIYFFFEVLRAAWTRSKVKERTAKWNRA